MVILTGSWAGADIAAKAKGVGAVLLLQSALTPTGEQAGPHEPGAAPASNLLHSTRVPRREVRKNTEADFRFSVAEKRASSTM